MHTTLSCVNYIVMKLNTRGIYSWNINILIKDVNARTQTYSCTCRQSVLTLHIVTNIKIIKCHFCIFVCIHMCVFYSPLFFVIDPAWWSFDISCDLYCIKNLSCEHFFRGNVLILPSKTLSFPEQCIGPNILIIV